MAYGAGAAAFHTMKRQLVLRLEAEAGIAEAVNFYKTKSEATLGTFIEVLNETFDVIGAAPRLYAIRFGNVRRVNLAKFPYALWFEIVARTDATTGENIELVVMLRCYHQRRNVLPHLFE